MQKPRKSPKYCHGYVDRHGRPRWYLRRPGHKQVPLPGLPWSPTFMEAYEQAMSGDAGAISPGEGRIIAGSVSAVVAAYYNSLEYSQLHANTRRVYRLRIERFRREHGDKPVALIQRDHIKAMMARRHGQPEAANAILRVCRILMSQALEMGLRKDDPTIGIKRVRSKTGGFATWTEEQIEQFQAHHRPGTRPHLAMALLVNTGQRRSDIVRMGWQHCDNGWLTVNQVKTGATVTIPVHPELQEAINATARGNMTFLVTAQGKPFTPAGFTNWFRECVKEAGLPDGLSAHGLRKAVCRRLAEAGCTPHEIMAISGHKTLSEVTRYTREAGLKGLAAKAFDKRGDSERRTKRQQKLANLEEGLAKITPKSLK